MLETKRCIPRVFHFTCIRKGEAFLHKDRWLYFVLFFFLRLDCYSNIKGIRTGQLYVHVYLCSVLQIYETVAVSFHVWYVLAVVSQHLHLLLHGFKIKTFLKQTCFGYFFAIIIVYMGTVVQ